jgi:hypothetical protein
MQPRDRLVTQMPLEHLWNTGGELRSARVRSLGLEDLRTLLRSGPVRFVVADAGKPLRWVEPGETFRFWKREACARIADTQAFSPEDFPDGVAYVASLWEVDNEQAAIVLLEAHH